MVHWFRDANWLIVTVCWFSFLAYTTKLSKFPVFKFDDDLKYRCMPTMKLNELLEDFYITMKKTDGSDFLARFDNAWTRWSRMWVLFSPSPAAPSALPPESSRRSLKSRARLGWLVSTLAMLTASPFLMKKRCGRQDAWEITAP
ncbi:hypothetical protein Q9966_012991 [Columba livia]|nr:hypothetical protein Q9966_012991 [Columba livia]